MIGRILVLVSLLYHCAKGAIVCSVSCEEGQFCHQSECRSCPHGTFVEEPIHQRTSCNLWTTKPPDSHFVIAREGSSSFDVLWVCEDGYDKSSDDMCLPRTTSHSTTTTHATTPTSVSTMPTTTAVTYNSPEGSESNLLFILIPIFVIIISACLFIIVRKYQICSQQTHNLCGLLHCNETALPNGKSRPDKAGGDQEELLAQKLPKDINFQFFHPIIQKLVRSNDVDAAEKFLRALPDPSKIFHAQISIEFQQIQFRYKETYLTHCCLEWATKNWDVADHKQYVYEALKFIERTDIIHQIQDVQHDKLMSMNADIDIHKSTANLQTACQDLSESSHADRFKFWYFLANKLDVGDSEILLYRLPNTDTLFNAKNFYDQKKVDHHGFQLSFVDTLEEWHLRHPDCVILDCIREILSEMGRNDVIYDEEFVSTNDSIDRSHCLSTKNVTEDGACLSTKNVTEDGACLSTKNVTEDGACLSTNVTEDGACLSTNDVTDEEKFLLINNITNDVPFLSRNDVIDGKEFISRKARVKSRTAVSIVT